MEVDSPPPPSYHTATPGGSIGSDHPASDAMSGVWEGRDEVREEISDRPKVETIPPAMHSMDSLSHHRIRVALDGIVNRTDYHIGQVRDGLRKEVGDLELKTGGALRKVNTDLQAVHQEQANFRVAQATLSQNWMSTENKVQSCEEKIVKNRKDLENGIMGTNERINSIARAVAPIQEVQVQVGRLETRIGGLSQGTNPGPGLEEINRRVGETEGTCKTVHDCVEQLKKAMSDLRVGLQREVGGMGSRVSGVEQESQVLRREMTQQGEVARQSVEVLRRETSEGLRSVEGKTKQQIEATLGHIHTLAESMGDMGETQRELLQLVHGTRGELRAMTLTKDQRVPQEVGLSRDGPPL